MGDWKQFVLLSSLRRFLMNWEGTVAEIIYHENDGQIPYHDRLVDVRPTRFIDNHGNILFFCSRVNIWEKRSRGKQIELRVSRLITNFCNFIIWVSLCVNDHGKALFGLHRFGTVHARLSRQLHLRSIYACIQVQTTKTPSTASRKYTGILIPHCSFSLLGSFKMSLC